MMGLEIWYQIGGKVDVFICVIGIGGMLVGIMRYFKDKFNGKVKSFLVDFFGSVFYFYLQLGGKLIERFGLSIMEGIGQGRVIDNFVFDVELLDGSLYIGDEKIIEMVYRCLDEEGLYFGVSFVLNVVVVKEVVEKFGKGYIVVMVFCDGVYRYVDRLFFKKWFENKNLLSVILENFKKYIVFLQ